MLNATNEPVKEIPQRESLTLETGKAMLERAKAEIKRAGKSPSLFAAVVINLKGEEVVLLEKGPGRLASDSDI